MRAEQVMITDFGNRLCAFRDGVFRELTRKDQTYGGLNLAGRDGRLFRVSSEFCGGSNEPRNATNTNMHTGCLCGNTLENVVYKGIQDGHGLVRDTSVGMNLLKNCRSRSTKRNIRLTRDAPL